METKASKVFMHKGRNGNVLLLHVHQQMDSILDETLMVLASHDICQNDPSLCYLPNSLLSFRWSILEARVI